MFVTELHFDGHAQPKRERIKILVEGDENSEDESRPSSEPQVRATRTRIEGLCVMLRRLMYTHCLTDLVPMCGYSDNCEILSHKNQFVPMLRLRIGVDHPSAGTTLDRSFVRTVKCTGKLKVGQRDLFRGHKYCVKFRHVMVCNGLIIVLVLLMADTMMQQFPI